MVEATAEELDRDLGWRTAPQTAEAPAEAAETTANAPAASATKTGEQDDMMRRIEMLERAARGRSRCPGESSTCWKPGRKRNHDHERNAMTVDVEDYFQVQAFAHCIHRDDWDSFPRRVEHNTNRILDSSPGRTSRRRSSLWAGSRSAPSGAGPPHRRGWPRTGQPWLGPHARLTARIPTTFRADIAAPGRCWRISAACAVNGYRAATFSIGARNAVGVFDPATGGLSLQLQHQPDPPRPVRHTGRAARAVPPGSERRDRIPDDHGAADRAATGPAPAAAISACCPRCCTGRACAG